MKGSSRVEPPRSYVRPDGGYGWFIIFATFLCYVCVSGTTKANGLFFVYFLESFGASNSATSAITFVQKISETITALMWSILAERYGSRIIVLCGAVTATIGAVLSAFAPNIIVITLTYGVICGMSFSMINYPAVQMLPRYFEKRLVIATALIYCGTPVGSLTVPYILTQAVEAYGLSGAFFIVAGVLFHIFVAGVLLRPLLITTTRVVEVEDVEAAVENFEDDTNDGDVCACRSVSQYLQKPCTCTVNEASPEPSFEAALVKREESADEATLTASNILTRPSLLTSVSIIASPDSAKKRKFTFLPAKSEVIQEEAKTKTVTVRTQSYLPAIENLRMRRLKSQLSTGSVSSVAAMENMAVSFAIMDNMSMASVQNVTAIGRQLSIVPYAHMNSTQVGSRAAMRFDRRQSKILGEPEKAISRNVSTVEYKDVENVAVSQPTPPSSSASEPSALDDDIVVGAPPSPPPNILHALVKKYRTIVRDKLFLLLAFSNFLHSFAMSLWVIFQQAYIVDLGYHDSFRQIFLISVSSFAELGSRLSLGFIISRNWLQVYRWNQVACTLMALAMFTYPFVMSFPILVLYNCFVASVFSINVVTSMPNLKEFLGIDMAALGQGLMVIPVGLGIVSVQIGGAIRDYTGSFVPAFYMAGFALLLSTINFQIIGFMSHHQHLPCWMCFFYSSKEVKEDHHETAVITETLLSNNTHDITLSTPTKQRLQQVIEQSAEKSCYLQAPPSVLSKTPRNFTDEVIEMLQRDQSLLEPAKE